MKLENFDKDLIFQILEKFIEKHIEDKDFDLAYKKLNSLNLLKHIDEIFPNSWDIYFDSELNKDIKVKSRSLDGLRLINADINTFKEFILNSVEIHFPEVTIRDSLNTLDGHLIRDLFIRVSIGYNGLPYEIEGKRNTLSYAEYCSQYLHSHLHTGTELNNYGYFCLGDTLLSRCLRDFNEFDIFYNGDIDNVESKEDFYKNYNFKTNKITNFLLNLITLASHESTAGVPYIRYANVRVSRSSNRFSLSNSMNTYRLLERYFRHFIKNNIDFIRKNISINICKYPDGESYFDINPNNSVYDKLKENLLEIIFDDLEEINLDTLISALTIYNPASNINYYKKPWVIANHLLKSGLNNFSIQNLIKECEGSPNINLDSIPTPEKYFFRGEEKETKIVEIPEINEKENLKDKIKEVLSKSEIIVAEEAKKKFKNFISNEYTEKVTKQSA